MIKRRTPMRPGKPLERGAGMKRTAFKPSSATTIAPKPEDPRYREFRITVKNRAHCRCQRCGRPGEEAHHLMEKGSSRFYSVRFEPLNGIYLCGNCHQWGKQAAHLDRVAFRKWWAQEDPEGFGSIYDAETDRPRRADTLGGEGL